MNLFGFSWSAFSRIWAEYGDKKRLTEKHVKNYCQLEQQNMASKL